MAIITILGTANAVPDKDHESAHLLVEAGERMILIDCAGNPIVRLDQGGFDPCSITDIILTHFHPDHVGGLPILLLDLLLLGRKNPLNIFGLQEVIDQVVQMMDLFKWQEWGEFFPVEFHRLSNQERLRIIDSEDVKVWTSPVCHMVPTIGILMQFDDGSICYSADTAPCDSLVRLAEGVNILIHEATGQGVGHTSPEQAGEIAQKAGAGQLILIHYPTKIDLEEWVGLAKRSFPRKVNAAQDWMKITV